MEERVAPSADNHPQSQSPPKAADSTTPTDDVNLSLQLARPAATGFPSETYVVQVPRDQIYRVPPPENARIIETYRQQAAPKAKTKRVLNLMSLIWVAVALVVIGILTGIGLLVLYRSFTPKAPVFSVSKLHVKKSTSNPPKYDVTLKVRNPNEKMGIEYGSIVDSADLTFWTKRIGIGQIPSFYQNSGDSSVVDVKLDGPQDQQVPHNIQKSMNDKKPTHPISLVLQFNSPLLMNVWIFKLWHREMDVECHFRVNTLGEGIKVLEQDCKTTLS